METLFQLITFFKLHNLSFVCYTNSDSSDYVFTFMLGKFDFSFHISDNGVIIESEKDFKKMAVSKISVDELKKRILSVKYLVND